MPQTSGIAHDYDPGMVHHSLSVNLPHLSSWIEDLLRVTDQHVPVNAVPSTEHLVQALQRYDSCFRELLKQTAIFSDDITRLYSKLWIGVVRLLDTMIKIYHRYVKQTTKTQEHAQKLINERQAHLAAEKVHKEEIELERAALKAKIRNLEGEIKSLGLSNRSLKRENRTLREVIDVYIEAKGDSEDITDESAGMDSQRRDAEEEEDRRATQAKEYIDAGRLQLKAITAMDIEMNDIMSNVLKEEDRQLFLLSQFSSLIEQNADLFGISKQTNSRGDKVIKAPTMEMSIQTDEIEEFGVITEREPDEFTYAVVIPSWKPPRAPTANPKAPGSHIPQLMRRHMLTYPLVLRIPPLQWTVKAIFAAYFAMIRTVDMQALLARKAAPVKISLPDFVYEFYLKQFSLSAVAENQISLLLRACEFHQRTHKGVYLFALQFGVMDKEANPDYDPVDTHFLLSVIRTLSNMGEMTGDLSFDHIESILLPPTVNAAMSVHMSPPSGLNRIASMNSSILSASTAPAAQQPRVAAKTNTQAEFSNDVSRSSAEATTRALFDKWYPDRGEDCAMKVVAMQSSSRDGRMVNVHDYLEICVDQWKSVRAIWEDHIQFLFSHFCCVYHSLHPLTYYNDQGVLGRDASLVLTQRAAPQEVKKRIVPYIDRFIAAARVNEIPRVPGGKSSQAEAVQGRDWVYELMPKRVFSTVMELLKPEITSDEIDEIYAHALTLQRDNQMHHLRKIWVKCPTVYPKQLDIAAEDADTGVPSEQQPPIPEGAAELKKLPSHFWVNRISGNSQWTTPYYANSYQCVDIDIQSFQQVLLLRDSIENCPLLEFFHMSPKDLWTNTDMFYKQLSQTKHREKRMTKAHRFL